MKASLGDQLKDVKIDYKAYGNLPFRDDFMYATLGIVGDDKEEPAEIKQLKLKKRQAIVDQWELLNYLRKNLKIVDRYIQQNRGETLNQWLKRNNENLKPEILKVIGGHNDATKGISMYFLNLQNMYDEEEALYDKMEASIPIPDIKSVNQEALQQGYVPTEVLMQRDRTVRGTKRANRIKMRKMKIADFDKNDQGYLIIPEFVEQEKANAVPAQEVKESPVAPEPQKESFGNDNGHNKNVENPGADGGKYNSEWPADGDDKTQQTQTNTAAKKTSKDTDDLRNKRINIGIAIAGTVLFIGAIVAISSGGKKTT